MGNTRITIGFPVIDLHELTLSCLQYIEKNTYRVDEIIIIDNGSKVPVGDYLMTCGQLSMDFLQRITVIRNKKNVGVRDSINQIYAHSHGDYVMLIHNDVQIKERYWDEKVREFLGKHKNVGVLGCYGAKGLGTQDIYQQPYEMHQLVRSGNVSDASMEKEIHGFRNLEREYENVIMFDGYCLIVNIDVLEEIVPLNKNILEDHHMYDAYICLESIKRGNENIVIPLDFYHLGGRTDVGTDWNKPFGKEKIDIHRDAHPKFYEYGRGILPTYIFDIYDEDDNMIGYQLEMNHNLIKTVMYE